MCGVIGSQSHGTTLPSTDAHATSDTDLFAVVLPPASYLVGLDTFEGWNAQFEDLDVMVYSFHKFCRLLLKSNPGVLSALWLRDVDYMVTTPAWDALIAERALFSTKSAYDAFAGYAQGQLHRMTAFSPAIQAEMDDLTARLDAAGWHLQDIMDRRAVPMPIGLLPDDAVAMADRLRSLRAKYHAAYMGEKRRALVLRHGFDVKNAVHMVRLLTMCVEFLQDGVLRVYRAHDAARLMAIKRGEVSLTEVQQLATQLFAEAAAAHATSPLPDAPDFRAVSDLVTRLVLARHLATRSAPVD